MNRSERVAAVAERYTAAKKFAGIEWQIQVDGNVVDQGQAGSADGNGAAIPQGAIYRIFSMTKPIVSVLALQLVEAGLLRLYDMLPQFDPRFAAMRVVTPEGAILPANRPITVEDLLTHRAGFTYEFIQGCHIAQYYREAKITHDGQCSLDTMMERLAAQPLAFQPGTGWRYSVSIDVLAHVIERATGRGLEALLKEYLFDPLGMEDTAFSVPEAKQDRLMPMFGVSDLGGLPALEITPQVLDPLDVEEMHPVNKPDTFVRGGLGLYSTTSDYAAFARMLIDGKAADGTVLLSRKMLEMLRDNRIPETNLPIAIGANVMAGYGWGLIGRVRLPDGTSNSVSSEGEFGWAGAATTYFWVDPVERMSGVVMTQFLGASLPLSDDMRTAAYQALP